MRFAGILVAAATFAHVVVALAILAVFNVTLASLAALPCPAAPGLSVCGWSWPPWKVLLYVCGVEGIEAVLLLVSIRFFGVQQLGLLPEGLAFRTRWAV